MILYYLSLNFLNSDYYFMCDQSLNLFSKKTLLAKDLKVFTLLLSLRDELFYLFNPEIIGPLEPFIPLNSDFYDFLKKKGIDWDIRDYYSSSWALHYHIFNTFLRSEAYTYFTAFETVKDMSILKNGVLTEPISEPRWSELFSGEYDHFIERGGLDFLKGFFKVLHKMWCLFPSIINDFLKYSLEREQEIKFELILIKYWCQIPEALEEVYILIQQFAPEIFLQLEKDKDEEFQNFDEYTLYYLPLFLPINIETKATVPFDWDFYLKVEKSFSNIVIFISKFIEQRGRLNDFYYFFKILNENSSFHKKFDLLELPFFVLIFNEPFSTNEFLEKRKEYLKMRQDFFNS